MQTFFAPQLIINDCAAAIEFYKKAFGVIELKRWDNGSGGVHVAELSFKGALFHIHEPTAKKQIAPETANGITTLIGVFVDDVHAVVNRAVDAGATLLTSVEDFDYGYRQGTIVDPFGHQWLIEKKI